MSKYYRTEEKDLEDRPEYTGEQVKENTTITTLYGDALVTPPNYVFTDSDGNKFGVAEVEVDTLYTKTKASKKA